MIPLRRFAAAVLALVTILSISRRATAASVDDANAFSIDLGARSCILAPAERRGGDCEGVTAPASDLVSAKTFRTVAVGIVREGESRGGVLIAHQRNVPLGRKGMVAAMETGLRRGLSSGLPPGAHVGKPQGSIIEGASGKIYRFAVDTSGIADDASPRLTIRQHVVFFLVPGPNGGLYSVVWMMPRAAAASLDAVADRAIGTVRVVTKAASVHRAPPPREPAAEDRIHRREAVDRRLAS